MPASALDLDTVFRQLLQPTSLLQRLGASGGPGSAEAAAAAAASSAISGGGAATDAATDAAAPSSAAADAAAAAAGSSRRSSGAGGLSSLAPSGDASQLYADLFRYYDKDRSGALERDEFTVCLAVCV